MENTVHIDKGHSLTTSRAIASKYGIKHKVVIDAIKSLNCSSEFLTANFLEEPYITKNALGILSPKTQFLITKNGLAVLELGFSSEKETILNHFDLADSVINKQRFVATVEYSMTLQRNVIRAIGITGSMSALARRMKISTATLSIIRNFGISGHPKHKFSETMLQHIEEHVDRIVNGYLGYDPEIADAIIDVSEKADRKNLTRVLKDKAIL